MSRRKGLMDERAKTFESTPDLFGESGLPPSPVRGRRQSLPGPPSMPALPPDAIKARRHHESLGELEAELEVDVKSAVQAILPNLTPESPMDVQSERVLWLVTPEAAGGKGTKSPVFTIP